MRTGLAWSMLLVACGPVLVAGAEPQAWPRPSAAPSVVPWAADSRLQLDLPATSAPAVRPQGRARSVTPQSFTFPPLPPTRPALPADAGSPQRVHDKKLRRVQAVPGDMTMPLGPLGTTGEASMPLSLEAALYGALTNNPDLVALRQGNVASAEAVEVAKRFPVTLNPTLWVDVRPLVYERVPHHHVNQKDALMYFSWRQPLELGHQTTYRAAIAQALFTQAQWNVVQAELLALVQTYRFYQTASYRREKLRVALRLADFNEKLAQTLRQRLEANQGSAADAALAEVEGQATRQQVEAARVDYVTALTDLRNQLGVPETAGSAEPFGAFTLPPYIPPADDQALIQTALESRPEIHAARAQVEAARAAVCLARGDRIPSPVVGPIYERDEQGSEFFGFVYITSIPIVNNGAPLVRQREAEYRRAVVSLQQVEQRTTTQVKAAVAKWNQANQLVQRTHGLTDTLKGQVAKLERLFEANQADLTKLFQARQRLIQLENSQLDSVWQAAQAQADLLMGLGAPTLIAAARSQAVGSEASPAPPSLPAASPAPLLPAPSAPQPQP